MGQEHDEERLDSFGHAPRLGSCSVTAADVFVAAHRVALQVNDDHHEGGDAAIGGVA